MAKTKGKKLELTKLKWDKEKKEYTLHCAIPSIGFDINFLRTDIDLNSAEDMYHFIHENFKTAYVSFTLELEKQMKETLKGIGMRIKNRVIIR